MLRKDWRIRAGYSLGLGPIWLSRMYLKSAKQTQHVTSAGHLAFHLKLRQHLRRKRLLIVKIVLH
jgi:hypothetical protein